MLVPSIFGKARDLLCDSFLYRVLALCDHYNNFFEVGNSTQPSSCRTALASHKHTMLSSFDLDCCSARLKARLQNQSSINFLQARSFPSLPFTASHLPKLRPTQAMSAKRLAESDDTNDSGRSAKAAKSDLEPTPRDTLVLFEGPDAFDSPETGLCLEGAELLSLSRGQRTVYVYPVSVDDSIPGSICTMLQSPKGHSKRETCTLLVPLIGMSKL